MLADIGPLRESPAFRRLWIGGALSGMGSQMTGVAVPIQVYGLTHSSFAVGAIGLALAGPLIILGLFGGTVADAVDRRRLVLITSTLLAGISFLFALQAIFHLHQLALLYVLTALQSSLVAIDSPARRTFVPRLLPPERISAAAALSFLSFQVSMIVGPLIAGILIAAFGLQAAYLADVVSFSFSLYSVSRLPAMAITGGGTVPGLGAVAEGLRFVRRQVPLMTALLVDLDATIFGMPFALFPALAATRFGGGSETVGLLYASPAIGGLVSATFSGSLPHLRRQGLAVLLAVATWGAAIAAFGFTSILPLAVLFLAIAGGADVVNGVFRTTILQVNTPDELQGRVNSVGFVVGAGGPRLGDVEAGVVATLTTPVISAISGGLACLAGVIALSLLFPAFARYDVTADSDDACPNPTTKQNVRDVQ